MASMFSFLKRQKTRTDHLEEIRREQGARLARTLLTYQHRLANYLNQWQYRVGFQVRNVVIVVVMTGLFLFFLIPAIQSLVSYSENQHGNQPNQSLRAGSLQPVSQSATAKRDTTQAGGGGRQDTTAVETR